MTLRSWLFVPGDSEKMLGKAASLDADALVLDLEDGVAEGRKPVAKKLIREYLDGADRSGSQLWVRINALDTPHALSDLCSFLPGRPHGIMVPKAEHGDDAERLARYLEILETEHGIDSGSTRLFLVALESPAAVLNIASFRKLHSRVIGLTWGAEDMASALRAMSNRDERGEFTDPYVHIRTMCLMAASVAGVQPVDTAFLDLRDLDGLRANCQIARRDGFSGKIAIHPAQVGPINEAFMPGKEEIEHAQAVVEIFARNPDSGAVSLNGQMLDRPHLKQAEQILALVSEQANR